MMQLNGKYSAWNSEYSAQKNVNVSLRQSKYCAWNSEQSARKMLIKCMEQ